jgi:hypothetical protein
MKVSRLLIAGTVSVLFAGCGSNGDAPKLLVSTPKASTSVDATTATAPDPQCKPLPESPGQAQVSNLLFKGPCSFVETGTPKCIHHLEDFYVYVRRDLPDGGQFVLTANVEQYKGPGRYDTNVLYLQITRNGLFYFWIANKPAISIDAGETAMTIEGADLTAQPGSPAQGTIRLSGVAGCPTID